MSWFDDVRAMRLNQLAPELGMERGSGGRWSPCPACGATSTGKDRRPAVIDVKGGAGWKCYACGEKGSALDAACLMLFDARLSGRDARWSQVRAWYAARGWCEGPRGVEVPKVKPRPALPPKPPKQPPPWGEVHALWEACTPARDDEEVAAWVRRRMPWVADVVLARDDLVRVVPAGALPRWASYKGNLARAAPWNQIGLRAVFAVADERGRRRSLRARFTGTGPAPKAKAVSAWGRVSGFVMANQAGRELLRDGPECSPKPGYVVVAEGEVKFLGACANTSNPVFGIVNGSWKPAVAERVPSGIEVWVASDNDPAGDEYYEEIRETLAQRCTVKRWHRPQEATHGPTHVH